MSAYPNVMWHDSHMYGGASSSSSDVSGPGPSLAASFDPLSATFIHSPYAASSETNLHAPLLAQSISTNAPGGCQNVNNVFDPTVRMGAPFNHQTSALGGGESLESLQERLMAAAAAAAAEGSDEVKNKAMLHNSMVPNIEMMQQQHYHHHYHQQQHQQQQQQRMNGVSAAMQTPHPSNAEMTMPWSTIGTSSIGAYPFASEAGSMPNIQLRSNTEMTNVASPASLNGHPSAAMSILAHNGDGGVATMQNNNRLSMPSSPALINALHNASHAYAHTPHVQSPLTNNEVSGSESANSAPVRQHRKASHASTVGGSTAGSTRRTKFRRSRSGCMVCRKRKVKCDQDGLPCKQCRIGERDCHYEENPTKRKRKSKSHSGQMASKSELEDHQQDTVRGNYTQSPTRSSSVSPSRSSTRDSLLDLRQGKETCVTASSTLAAEPMTNSNHGSLFSQQELLKRLTDQVNGTAVVAPDGNTHSVFKTAETTSDEDRTNEDLLQQWARSVPSSLSMLNAGSTAGFDDWNSTTPSTGATSLHTLDSEHGLHGSNISSRRVTLTDVDSLEANGDKVDGGGASDHPTRPLGSATVGVHAPAFHHSPLAHFEVSGIDSGNAHQI